MQGNNIEDQNKRYKPSKLEIYGLRGLFILFLNLVKTKLFFPSARIIRFPVDIRGRKYITFGTGLTMGKGCRIEAFPYLNQTTIISIGNNVEINDYVHITGVNRVTIGDNVLLASKIYISDSNHGAYDGKISDTNPEEIARHRPVSGKFVTIEDNVWIGESVAVLGGVTIGRCSIIGANSVVTKDIPPFTIAVGNPVRLIKKYNFELKIWQKI